MQKTDVLIVGAGPTGLMMATQLLRLGISFVIIDKKEGPTDQSRALVIHARSLEIYDQLGLADKATAGGQVLNKVAFLSEGKLAANPDFSELGKKFSPFPYFLIFDQASNEHLLYDHIKEQGFEVRWQTELQSFTQDEHGVRAEIRTASGNSETIEAKYFVGCDGASSRARHLLNLGFEGSTFPRLFYVADVEMTLDVPEANLAHDSSTLVAALGENSYLLMIPMVGENHWRFTGNLPDFDPQDEGKGAEAEDIPFEAIIERVKRQTHRPITVSKVHWFSKYKVHTRHVEKFSVGRCFLAGDAAHVHTPAGGQGMNTGLQDAYNLAWKLALVLRERASAELLETYNEERLANAHNLVKSTDQIFDVLAGGSWSMQFLRKYFLPGFANLMTRFEPVRELMFPALAETAITYRDHSLAQHRGDASFKVKAGDRMPYFLVEGKNIYDYFQTPKFHAIVFSDGQQRYVDQLIELSQNDDQWLDLTVLPLYGRVAELFGNREPFLVLLRPDNYIALISPEISPAPVSSYLTGKLGSTQPQR